MRTLKVFTKAALSDFFGHKAEAEEYPHRHPDGGVVISCEDAQQLMRSTDAALRTTNHVASQVPVMVAKVCNAIGLKAIDPYSRRPLAWLSETDEVGTKARAFALVVDAGTRKVTLFGPTGRNAELTILYGDQKDSDWTRMRDLVNSSTERFTDK